MNSGKQEYKFIQEFIDLDDLSSHSSSASYILGGLKRVPDVPPVMEPHLYGYKFPDSQLEHARAHTFDDTILCKDMSTPKPSSSTDNGFLRQRDNSDKENKLLNRSPSYLNTMPSNKSNRKLGDQNLVLSDKETISSPWKKLTGPTLMVDLDSSSISGISQDFIVEINQGNMLEFKNDYICGVIDKDGIQCLENLTCHKHTLTERNKVKRSYSLADLVYKESRNLQFFVNQREFITNHIKNEVSQITKIQNTSNQVLLKYDLSSKDSEKFTKVQETIVLGTEVPFSRQKFEQPTTKRRKIKVDANSNSCSKSSKGSISTYSKITTSDASKSSSTISKSTKSSDSKSVATKLSENKSIGSKSDSSSSVTGKSKILTFAKKLSKETSTRIKETVSYLHYRLKDLQNTEVEERCHKLERSLQEFQRGKT